MKDFFLNFIYDLTELASTPENVKANINLIRTIAGNLAYMDTGIDNEEVDDLRHDLYYHLTENEEVNAEFILRLVEKLKTAVVSIK